MGLLWTKFGYIDKMSFTEKTNQIVGIITRVLIVVFVAFLLTGIFLGADAVNTFFTTITAGSGITVQIIGSILVVLFVVIPVVFGLVKLVGSALNIR